MTQEQAKYSWFEKEYTLEQLEEIEILTPEQEKQFAEHCFAKGVKAIYITTNDLSCTVLFSQDGKAVIEYIKPIKLEAPILDTAGQSEAFAAGVVYGLIRHNSDYIKAGWYGNTLCAQRTRGITYDVFDSLEDTLKTVQENYGSN